MDVLSYGECKEFLPDINVAKCVRVYDGDTIHLGIVLPKPYGPTRFCCRLIGIDTPELRSRSTAEKKLAREARDLVKSMILNKVVNVRIAGKDKYGRLLVCISTTTCSDLSQYLIDERVAVYYDGGKKRQLCWESLLKEHTELKSKRITQDVAVLQSTSDSQN